MSSRDLSLAMRLYADATRFVQGLNQAEGGVRKFGGVARREFDALKNSLTSVQGKLATLGVSVGAVATIVQSARFDKSLTQIGQTAGVSSVEVAGLRKELFRLAGDTGQGVDDLQLGFNNLIQSGLKWGESMQVIDATNKAMAVTGANANSLTGALSVAGAAFDFDLSKPNQALLILDKMTVAGRLGNAELENLSSIISRVGINAGAAGFSFDQTLAFVEGLSQIERQPERLATLADSTLRLFNNMNYMKAAARATGVSFYDKNGSRRDPVSVIEEIKKKYDKLKTDQQKDSFVGAAFGAADLDTIKGIRKMLGGNTIDVLRKQAEEIKKAGGTIERDLPAAINNAVDQTGRLKAELRNAADGFVKPINATLSKWIKAGLDKKENGGLGLDGTDILLGGAATGVGAFLAARYGKKGVAAFAKRFGGTAAGVTEGKALEAVAGVTPVFVVNWPGTISGGITPDIPLGGSQTPGKPGGTGNLAKGGGYLAVGAALSYFGYNIFDGLSEIRAIQGENKIDPKKRAQEIDAKARAAFDRDILGNGGTALLTATKSDNFNQELKQYISGLKTDNKAKITVGINVNQSGLVDSVRTSTNNPNMPLDHGAGLTMRTP